MTENISLAVILQLQNQSLEFAESLKFCRIIEIFKRVESLALNTEDVSCNFSRYFVPMTTFTSVANSVTDRGPNSYHV